MDKRKLLNINYLKNIITLIVLSAKIKLMATDKRQFLNIN